MKFDICTLTPTPSCNHLCVCAVRTLEFYFFLSYWIHLMLFLMVVTTLYIKSPEFITESLSSLISSFTPLFLHLPASGNHHSTLCCYEFRFLRFHIKVRSCNICLSLLHFTLFCRSPPVLLRQLFFSDCSVDLL